ncbi:MAG: hypothetical protein IKP65_07460 [Alphaproteobacteria bacterium]|nr:hypothetical protein [Alphaproteobacteria bacterium]
MNNWTSDVERESKKNATSYAVTFFPDCKNKTAIFMPSTTCYDIIEMKKQNKINDKTNFHIVDNLKSPDFKDAYDPDEYFKLKTRKTLKQILNTNNKLNVNFYFENIQDIINLKKNTFDLIYADTCCNYNESLRDWIRYWPTIQSIKKNGVFALNVTLNRYNIDYPIKLKRNPVIKSFNNTESNKKNMEKVKMIASDIENNTKYIFKTVALIQYYDKIQSQMGLMIFKKMN